MGLPDATGKMKYFCQNCGVAPVIEVGQLCETCESLALDPSYRDETPNPTSVPSEDRYDPDAIGYICPGCDKVTRTRCAATQLCPACQAIRDGKTSVPLTDYEDPTSTSSDPFAGPDFQEKALKALTDAIKATSSAREKCDTHAFAILHEDREHVMIFCQGCGLIRAIELRVARSGQLPICDVPTPIALPDAWAKLGGGIENHERAVTEVRFLNEVVRISAETEPATVLRAFHVLADQIKEHLEEENE